MQGWFCLTCVRGAGERASTKEESLDNHTDTHEAFPHPTAAIDHLAQMNPGRLFRPEAV